MNIIFHYPKTEEGAKCLRSLVATAHAEYVIAYLNRIPFSKRDKEKIISAVIHEKTKDK